MTSLRSKPLYPSAPERTRSENFTTKLPRTTLGTGLARTVCVSLERVVIICPASTHTALVSSPSLTVLHLPNTYIRSGGGEAERM